MEYWLVRMTSQRFFLKRIINVASPGKGMVDRVKDYYGSWFAKPEENQSPQGNSFSLVHFCIMLCYIIYDMILIFMLLLYL
jgi:hypothetical protein